jgi:hypothetical protein
MQLASRMTRTAKFFLIAVALLALLTPWCAGSHLVAPKRSIVGGPPTDLAGELVEIQSESGSLLQAWFVPGPANAPAIVLLHGLEGSRLTMLGRARWLHDFQCPR